SHVGQLLAVPPAERSAGSGQHQRMHYVRGLALEALEGSGVLAVDRQQPASSTSPRRGRQLACRHEALLVRKGQIGTPLERPEGRRQACEADDSVEDEVRLRTLEQLR